jgi:hypothetical protein
LPLVLLKQLKFNLSREFAVAWKNFGATFTLFYFVPSLFIVLGLTQQPASLSTEKIQWVRYNDSAEGAFDIDVPLGWQIQGGMYRFGYFDARWMIGARSLDGKVIILVNDVNVPPYVLPGPNTGREGQPYGKPQQMQMVISQFQEAQPYAEIYAKHRFRGICNSLAPSSESWQPTVRFGHDDLNPSRRSNGSVSYNCDSTDGPRIATVFSRNTLFQGPNYAFWTAEPVSILCSPDRCAQAREMAQHMMESWEKNPQWVQYQDRLTKIGLQQIQAAFGQFMQQMQQFHQQFTQSLNAQVSGYYARQDAQAKQVSNWCDNINGVTNVTDPKTGAKFQVFAGPKSNYYTNGLGVRVNSNLSPGPSFYQTPVTDQ